MHVLLLFLCVFKFGDELYTVLGLVFSRYILAFDMLPTQTKDMSKGNHLGLGRSAGLRTWQYLAGDSLRVPSQAAGGFRFFDDLQVSPRQM